MRKLHRLCSRGRKKVHVPFILKFSMLLLFITGLNISGYGQEGTISHLDVNGNWSGIDANGNSIIKWVIKVCTDGPVDSVKVFTPSTSMEGAGVANMLGDDDSPGNTSNTLCCPGNWTTVNGGRLSGSRVTRCGGPNGEITPNGGLDFTQSGTGCAEITWTSYSKDYDSSGDDENHYVVAAACVACDEPDNYDCTGEDSNGNQGCTAVIPNSNIPACTNVVDCADIATNNYEQILGLSFGLDTVIKHKEGYVELVTAHITCHHGEADYVTGRELSSPAGTMGDFDVLPRDIKNIEIVSPEFARFSSFGTLDSVRIENPNIVMLQPAPAFAPFGATIPFTSETAQSLTSDASTLSVSAAINGVGDMPNNSNGVEELGCETFMEICDTIYVHSFWTPDGNLTNCSRFIQTYVDDYCPGAGVQGVDSGSGYQQVGGVSEGPPRELSDQIIDNAANPDDENGDCDATIVNTCGAASGDDCTGETIAICLEEPAIALTKSVINVGEDINDPDFYFVDFEILVCNDEDSEFILEDVDLEDPLLSCIDGAEVVPNSVTIDPTVIPSNCVAGSGFPMPNMSYNGDSDVNLTDGNGAIDPGSCIRVTFQARIPFEALNSGSETNKANVSATDITGNFTVTENAETIIPLPQPDLALTKSTSITSPVDTGDIVTFTIEITNQGDVPMDSVKVNDYVPAGLMFNAATSDPDWMLMDDTVMIVLQGADLGADSRLEMNESVTIDIDFKVLPALDVSDYVNISEISEMWDTLGLPRGNQDIDSTPDNDPDNDAGGAVNTPSDDATGGNGMGSAGGTDPMTDEDDSDPATLPVMDLALAKRIDATSIPATGIFMADDMILYNIQIINQGNIEAVNVEVKDTIPCGFNYVTSSGWTGSAPVLTHLISSLDPGADTTLQIILELKSTADVEADCAGVNPNDWYINRSYIDEINAVIEGVEMPVGDIDSDPGPMTPEELATRPIATGDNNVDSKDNDGIGSQDDSDPAGIQVFDLALRKVLNPNENPYNVGDTATFEICVFNQNTVPTDSIVITDYIPIGYTYVSTPNNDLVGWDYDMGTSQATASIFSNFPEGDSLGFGDSVCVSIDLEVQFEDDYVNTAEITSAQILVDSIVITEPMEGLFDTSIVTMQFVVMEDNDGSFDNDPSDDAGGLIDSPSDDELNGNGNGGPLTGDAVGDSDDSDVAFIELIPMSIGNQVWSDDNNNGELDDGELPIEGVEVVIHFIDPETGLCEALDTVYTDIDGLYLFDSLGMGDYIIEITPANFDPGGPLEDFSSSTGSGANTMEGPYEDDLSAIDPDDNTNIDDNGVLDGNVNFPGSVVSDTITLEVGEEPELEGLNPFDMDNDMSGAEDENSNLTVDFGFVPFHSIGNQVWEDNNNNGVIDHDEMLLEGVAVILHYVDENGDCIVIDTVFTDADGQYLFDSLSAGNYIVELAESNFEDDGPFDNYVSSTGGDSDLMEGPNEDAMMPLETDGGLDNTGDHGVLGLHGFPGIASDTIALGNDEPELEGDDPLDSNNDMSGAEDDMSNLTIDFGLVPLHSIGNQVWHDVNNDGVLDDGETEIEGVEVVLHYVDENGVCVVVDTVYTDVNGQYLFDTIPAGDYIVEITPANFEEGGPLENYASSSGGGPQDLSSGPNEDPSMQIDPDNNMNLDDNGVLDGNAMFPGSVVSDTLSLGEMEPALEGNNPLDMDNDMSGAADDNSNLTVDFGFVQMHSVGNQVWEDSNNNGVLDDGEEPIEGVEIVLHYVDEDGDCIVVDTVLTDIDGLYLFDSLLMGEYIIEITPENFDPGGPLEFYGSSTGNGGDVSGGPFEDDLSAIDPDNNTNIDDNGVLDGNAMFPGSVVSDTLSLGEMEPELEDDNPLDEDNDMSGAADDNSNLTVDFGFVPLHSVGNQVWEDNNNNGVIDDGEMLLEDVAVILHFVDENGVCIVIDTVFTDADGQYLFDSLAPGPYIVELAAENFEDGGPFDNYVSSTGGDSDLMEGPNEDFMMPLETDGVMDNTGDHGVLGLHGFPGIASDTINLGNDEPEMEGDNPLDSDNDMSGTSDDMSNLTIDFGLVPLHSIGNQVWHDVDNDGVLDDGETEIEGCLLYTSPSPRD